MIYSANGSKQALLDASKSGSSEEIVGVRRDKPAWS
jgi:hypothetical protein